MRSMFTFIFSITLLIGVSYITHGKDATEVRKIYIKKLFEKVDLSKHDKDIQSVLDKQHISQNELELLKAQALLEALEENAYDISSAEELVPFPAIRMAQIPQKNPGKKKTLSKAEAQQPKKQLLAEKEKKSFEDRLKDMPIQDRLKDEFSLFAKTLKNLVTRVTEEFETFQESPEVQDFQKEAEETAKDVGDRIEKMADDFMKSDQFKELQNTAADVFKRLNKALREGSTSQEEKKK